MRWVKHPTLPFELCEDGLVRLPTGHVTRGTRTGKRLWVWEPMTKGRRKSHHVHRLMCETFYGPRPDGMEVAHRNGDSLDNRLTNLRWATHLENEADKLLHGTRVCGERHGGHKLTDAQVHEIRLMLAEGVFQYVVAAKFGVTQTMISRIARRRAWKHVT